MNPIAAGEQMGVEVKASAIEGDGVFATRAFDPGDTITHIHIVREITADGPLRDGESYEHQSYPDGRIVLVGEPDRHVNHYCDPSAYKRFRAWNDVDTIARRRIEPGDEITFDYTINAFGGEYWSCRCGAARCRGEVAGDFFALPEDLQREYRPLLAPWFALRHRERLRED